MTELKNISRWNVTFQFHASGCFKCGFRVVMVIAAAVPEVREAPGLSTDTLLTVTNGWNGELPPGKMLSRSPMRVTNSPPPARNTVLSLNEYAIPTRGCQTLSVST